MKKEYSKPEIMILEFDAENKICALSSVVLLSTSEAFLPDEDDATYF